MCESAYRAKQLEKPREPENVLLDPGGFIGEDLWVVKGVLKAIGIAFAAVIVAIIFFYLRGG